MPTRADFLLRDDIIFLNHGSFGACPKPVFERYQAWQLELERQPIDFLLRRRAELMAARAPESPTTSRYLPTKSSLSPTPSLGLAEPSARFRSNAATKF